MFLFNAGVFALVRPVVVPSEVLRFHLPYAMASVVMITAFMTRRQIPRWAGVLFIALYAGFVCGTYLTQ